MAILPSYKTLVITCQPGLYYNTHLFITVRRRVAFDFKEESAFEKIEKLSSRKVRYQKLVELIQKLYVTRRLAVHIQIFVGEQNKANLVQSALFLQ